MVRLAAPFPGDDLGGCILTGEGVGEMAAWMVPVTEARHQTRFSSIQPPPSSARHASRCLTKLRHADPFSSSPRFVKHPFRSAGPRPPKVGLLGQPSVSTVLHIADEFGRFLLVVLVVRLGEEGLDFPRGLRNCVPNLLHV
jgi:hypothetical protein